MCVTCAHVTLLMYPSVTAAWRDHGDDNLPVYRLSMVSIARDGRRAEPGQDEAHQHLKGHLMAEDSEEKKRQVKLVFQPEVTIANPLDNW